MSSEEDKSNRSSVIQNQAVSIGTGSSVTFHMGTGTDTGTDKYFDLVGGVAYGVEILPTVACSITEFNGKAMKSALSVGTGGYRSNNVKITRLTIQAGSATVVEVSAKGGN